MISHFLLSIRFLDDRYHGQTDNGSKAEWPPSPFRVFQAMVAGNGQSTARRQAIREALLWLESRKPPQIIAPRAMPGQAFVTYVPNNVSDTDPNSRTPKTIRPTHLNGDRLVQYAWEFDTSQPDVTKHVHTLQQAARHINALGWGIDLAVGHAETVERLPPVVESRIQYRPVSRDAGSGADLRVPRGGSLISLERTYADFLRRHETPGVTRLESASAIYESQRYVVGLSRPCVAFRLVNADGDTVSLRHHLIKPLVGMVRNLACRPEVVAVLGQDTIDRQIMGHPRQSDSDRVSILPLPTIRNGPTDGRIRRVMIAQPLQSDGSLCKHLGELFDAQQLVPLSDDNRMRNVFLQSIRWRDKLLPYYTGVARVWASVTPVLLPGYDDRKNERGNHQKRLLRAEQLVRKALAQSGIDVSAHIELSRVPYWMGSLQSRDYQPREKLAHYPRWHVRLTFDRPWTGPLAIGAGRYCGFGLFAKELS